MLPGLSGQGEITIYSPFQVSANQICKQLAIGLFKTELEDTSQFCQCCLHFSYISCEDSEEPDKCLTLFFKRLNEGIHHFKLPTEVGWSRYPHSELSQTYRLQWQAFWAGSLRIMIVTVLSFLYRNPSHAGITTSLTTFIEDIWTSYPRIYKIVIPKVTVKSCGGDACQCRLRLRSVVLMAGVLMSHGRLPLT